MLAIEVNTLRTLQTPQLQCAVALHSCLVSHRKDAARVELSPEHLNVAQVSFRRWPHHRAVNRKYHVLEDAVELLVLEQKRPPHARDLCRRIFEDRAQPKRPEHQVAVPAVARDTQLFFCREGVLRAGLVELGTAHRCDGYYGEGLDLGERGVVLVGAASKYNYDGLLVLADRNV
jgi:hypothetical protein